MPSMVSGETFGEVWDRQLRSILESGKESRPRGFPIKELTGSVIYVEDSRSNILVNSVRNLNYKFMVAEWFWIALGHSDLDSIAFYNKEMRKFSDDGQKLSGAYGPHVEQQMSYIITTLKKDMDSRQAIISLWRPNPSPSKDIPCTLTMQFLVRNLKLNTIISMRSSDIWLGLPYDFFTFSMLANSLAGELGVIPGSLTMMLGSSHLYESHYEVAEKAAVENSTTLRSPELGQSVPAAMDMFLTHSKRDTEFMNLYYYHPVWQKYANLLWAPGKQEALSVLRDVEETFA